MPRQVRTKMTVVGERIVRELNGVSCLPLVLLLAAPERHHRLAFLRTASPATRMRSGRRWLRFVGRAGEKAALGGGLMAERITVFARTDRFNPARPCYSRMLTTTLPFPTDYTPALSRRPYGCSTRSGNRGSASRNAGSCSPISWLLIGRSGICLKRVIRIASAA